VKLSNSNPPAPGGDALVNFQIDPATGEISASYTPGGGGGGSVTHTGALASGQLIQGNGAADITVGDLSGDVATSGSTVTAIQANAVTTSKINNAAVTEAKIGLSNVTTNDVSITAHGFAPKAPNDATKFLDGTGAYSTPAGGSSTKIAQSQRKRAMLSADGSHNISSTLSQFSGDQCSVVGTVFNAGETPQGSPSRGNATSANNVTTNSYAGFAGGGSWRTGRTIDGVVMCYINRVTDIRAWIGFSTAISTNLTSSDTAPATKYAMFRFSTIAGDTHWQAICSNNSGTNTTIVDTGVTPDLAMHRFGIYFDDVNSQILFYIDGVLKATIATNLPASGNNLAWTTQALWIVGAVSPIVGLGMVIVEADL
jgi:hypothetical protein